MNKILTSLGVVGLAAMIIVFILFGPFFVIWAYNELFGTLHAIDYTFRTWLAVLIIGAFMRSKVQIKKD